MLKNYKLFKRLILESLIFCENGYERRVYKPNSLVELLKVGRKTERAELFSLSRKFSDNAHILLLFCCYPVVYTDSSLFSFFKSKYLFFKGVDELSDCMIANETNIHQRTTIRCIAIYHWWLYRKICDPINQYWHVIKYFHFVINPCLLQ